MGVVADPALRVMMLVSGNRFVDMVMDMAVKRQRPVRAQTEKRLTIRLDGAKQNLDIGAFEVGARGKESSAGATGSQE